jgi:hypothetical protein
VEELEARLVPTVSFAAQQTFATGIPIASVALALAQADLNGDGAPDLIAVGGSTLSVLPNTTPAGAATPSFAAAQTFAVGNGADFVAVADLNGDNKPDLIVANQTDNTVSVLLNTTTTGSGTVTFAPQQTFAVGTHPTAVAVGDFNGDNKPDLVVTNSDSGTVSVLLNTTTGGTLSFAAQQTFAVGVHPSGVAAADFNGDNKPDLAVSNQSDGTLSVLLNKTATGAATASFAAQRTFAAGTSPGRLTAVDINGDGKPDLAVSRTSGSTSVSVFLNSTATGATTASFAAAQTFATGPSPEGVAAADFDGDGKPDLAAANEAGGSVSVLVNATAVGTFATSFAARQNFATGLSPDAVVAVDLNGDGLPDLAALNSNDNSVSVLLNTTPPTSVSQFVTTGQGQPKVVTLSASAPNNDPVRYAISVNPSHGTVSAPNNLSNLVTYTPNPGYSGPDSFQFTATDTITGLTSVAATVSITVLPQPAGFTGQQTFTPGITAAATVSELVQADINGDGKPDLLVLAGNTLSVLLNTTPAGSTTASYAAGQTFTAGTSSAQLAVADFDGDGKPDVVITNFTDNTVSVLINTTATGSSTVTFNAGQTFTVGTAPYAIAVGDYNGDGKPDIAVSDSSNVAVLLNTTTGGTLSFAAQQTFAVGNSANPNPIGIAAVDVNGDNKPDLVVSNNGDNTVSVLLNTTTTGSATVTFTPQQTFAAGTGPRTLAVVDVNGDGKPDLAVAHLTGSSVSVLLNTTATGSLTASFTAQQAFATGSIPEDVVAADFNGDGKPDLAVENEGSNTLSVLLNTTAVGAPVATFTAQQTFAVGTSPDDVIAADFDGNGLPDLAAINSGPNTVSVLMNTTAPLATPPTILTGQGQAKTVTLFGGAPNNDPIAFSIAAIPAHGTLSGFNSSTGQVTYTPAVGYNGADSFRFTVTDSTTGFTATATVSITVLPPPTANAQTVVVGEGLSKNFTLTGSAPNGDAFAFQVATGPSHGTVSGTAPNLRYSPATGFTGTDSFTFTVTDATTGLTGTATVTLIVVPPPTGISRTVFINPNATTALTLTASVPNGDPFTLALGTGPAHGTLSGTLPNLTYIPATGFAGYDSFTFTVTDTASTLASGPATITFGVGIPVANPQAVGVAQSHAQTMTLTGSAPFHDPISFAEASGPAHGTLSGFDSTTGQVTYTPTGNYTGPDSFTFTVTDTVTSLTSLAVTVSVTVAVPPTANAQAMTVAQGQVTALTLSGSPPSPTSDPLVFTMTAPPAHGTLSSLTSTTGRITYTPFPGYLGLDSFQFTVTDTTTGVTSVAAATVGLTVAVPPTTSTQAVALVQGQSAPVTLTGTAPNGDLLTFALTAQPTHGTLSGFDSTTGAVTYAPTGNYVGMDSFTFTITDTTTGLTSAPATVRLTVSAARALVGEFGTTGVWQFDRSTNAWAQLTPANASLLAMDTNGDVAAEFPGYGLWEYQPGSGWKLLHGVDVSLLTMNASGTIAVEFPGYGVGQYSPGAGWRLLTAANASQLAIDANGDIAGAFPRYGVWEFQSSSGWHQLNGVDVTLLAMDPQGDVAANFRGYGVGEYTPGTGWRLLNGTQASALALDPAGDVLANFVGYGVAEFVAGSGGWRSLTTANAAALAADDSSTIYGAFAGFGVWQFDPTRGWVQLRTTDAAVLAAR